MEKFKVSEKNHYFLCKFFTYFMSCFSDHLNYHIMTEMWDDHWNRTWIKSHLFHVLFQWSSQLSYNFMSCFSDHLTFQSLYDNWDDHWNRTWNNLKAREGKVRWLNSCHVSVIILIIIKFHVLFQWSSHISVIIW